jgi:hypothetical protein
MVAWASAVLNTDARRCEANARLIAASPDLLEALEEFEYLLGGEADATRKRFADARAKARAAIAKARGQS